MVCQISSKPLEYGFVQSYTNYSLFTYKRGNTFIALPVYVDDIVLTGNDRELCTQFKACLNNCFHIKDIGPLKYFWASKLLEMTRAYFNVKGSMLSRSLKSMASLGPDLLSFLWKQIISWVGQWDNFLVILHSIDVLWEDLFI